MITTQETRTRVRPVAGGRTGGWLLALSPLGYAAVIATMAGVYAGVGAFGSITRAQMDELGAGWFGSHLLVMLAGWVPAAGAVLIALALLDGEIRSGRWAAWATVALGAVGAITAIPDLVASAQLQDFTTATLGEDPRWGTSTSLLPLTFGACILQLVLLCAALWLSRTLRTTGLVMGVISLAVLVVVLFAAPYVPPFAIALLGCPVGIAWLRGLRSARRGPAGLS
ncbi:MAG: hypothetical protein JST33_01025 [Actinobacteria bacterium]|nr:hypothetical protein [Actinomycetota bacterium]